jgi:hypothetical protein
LRSDWSDVCRNPDDFERLVKLLLQRLHSDGEVLDGRGGDGGREFQVRSSDSLTLYEAKSFIGRVTERNPKRRAQVERSLVSAARHQPDVWHLVVPIDHNPEELTWFEGLRSGDFPFVDRWLGQTWLEEQLARHDDLVRYATQDKLLEYVRQYKIEKEALAGGVSDLLDRHRALHELGDTISTHWRPIVSLDPDCTQVLTLQAKRPDAATAAPIRIGFTVAVPNTPDAEPLLERLRASLDFGTSVEIPGEFVSDFTVTGPPGLGLDPPEDLQRVVLAELRDTDDLPGQTLAVYEPGAAFPAATLSFEATERTTGAAGVRLVAYDSSRTVRLISKVRREGTFTVHLDAQQHPGMATPAAVLPAIRLMRAAHHPNTLVLTVRRGEASVTDRVDLPPGAAADVMPDVAETYIEDLAVIQAVLRQPFPLRRTISRGEADRAARLRRLLAGEVVPWLRASITVTLDAAKVGEFKAQFPSGSGQLRISYPDLEVEFGEHAVHTGPLFLIGTVTVDLDAIPDQAADGEDVPATFEVGGDGWFHAQRGIPPGEQQASELPSSTAGRVSYLPDTLPNRSA